MVTPKLPTLILLAWDYLREGTFPKTVTVGRIIPTIVTKYDTVKTTWRQVVRQVTTDTFNLIVRETIHDTVVVNVTVIAPRFGRYWFHATQERYCNS